MWGFCLLLLSMIMVLPGKVFCFFFFFFQFFFQSFHQDNCGVGKDSRESLDCKEIKPVNPRVSSGSWWWTGKPGVLQSMRSQRVGHGWATELNWIELRQNEWWARLVKWRSLTGPNWRKLILKEKTLFPQRKVSHEDFLFETNHCEN